VLRLRFTTFDDVSHTHELKLGTTRIGRGADNDLQIDELAVSRYHAEIRFDGKSIVVRDLESIEGTYVDGQLVTEGAVKAGQVISLGAFLMKVEASTGELADHSPQALQAVQLKDGSYSCLRHSTKRAMYECEGCFDLACEECVRLVENPGGSQAACCKSCGAACRTIDWTGLEMSTADSLKELFIPKKVKQALDFWDKHRDRLKVKRD
jgi:RNA polymerase subunit RPABC4/transcription elongation factor Spt4